MSPSGKKRVIGIFALFGVIGFFSLIVIIPKTTEKHLEGDRLHGSAIRAALPGSWTGYWRSLGADNKLTMSFSIDRSGEISGNGKATRDNCAGDGAYSVAGNSLAREIELTLKPENPGCGIVHIRYQMARSTDGRLQMKGDYLRMPNGNRGHHYLVRK